MSYDFGNFDVGIFRQTELGKRLMAEYGEVHDFIISKLKTSGATFEDISIGDGGDGTTVFFFRDVPMYRIKVEFEEVDGKLTGRVTRQEFSGHKGEVVQ